MLGSILGGIAGNIFDNGDEDSQKSAYQAALQAMQNVYVPTVEEQRIALQTLQQQGELTPEALQAVLQGNTGLKDIQLDPRLKNAQMDVLEKLQQQSGEGLTAEDRAALAQVRNSNERDARARNESILQNMAQRGMSGSGAELAAQLANSQAASENASSAGLNIAAQAQQRALQALQAAGGQASSVRSQDYQQASDAAKAQDVINQFNTANRQNTNQYNVTARNNAQAQNLAEKQRISDSNVNIKNQQETHNKGLYQQKFQNDIQKAGGVASQQNNMGNYYGQQAAQTRGMWSGIGSGLDQAAQAAATSGMFGGAGTGMEAARPSGDFMGPMPEQKTSPNWGAILSDKDSKKNVSDGTNAIEDFLDKLRSANYEYKDPNHGEGIHTGVIAQDVEKSHVGKNMIQETPEGKAIDLKKGFAAMLAANANLHHRVRKLEGSIRKPEGKIYDGR